VNRSCRVAETVGEWKAKLLNSERGRGPEACVGHYGSDFDEPAHADCGRFVRRATRKPTDG